MCSLTNIDSIDDNEIFIISLNRKIPLRHLNLMYCLDSKLEEFIRTKYDDISNMIQLTYNVKYDCVMIESILNLLKSNNISSSPFTLENANDIIRNYSMNHHFLSLASPNTIQPFTLICLNCQHPLKLLFKEKVNVFLLDRVDNGIIYSANCCHIEYHTNSYIKNSKRLVVHNSLHNQKYITFGGKCVLSIELLLRYASDLISMYTGFENFCESYNDTIKSLLLQSLNESDPQIKNQPMLERRLFENIWLIYSSSLLEMFLSKVEEIEIPLNISNRDQRNSFLTSHLPSLEQNFTLFWSSHSLNFNCGHQCSRAIVIDGFQKPDRFVCQFSQKLIHSEELGDIEWSCGFRPEMIRDKAHPGYWTNTKYCPEHIHLENNQSENIAIDKDEYDSIDCNVSRDLPKYLIYDNACGLLLTLQKRLQNGQIQHTIRSDTL
ncbi:unnamed protein product [Rotaria socialis]|nr:unnamed protein product [Rotaria socialis]CAF3439469.1 unnamed protein product [Rotaria socialis]